MCRQPPTPPLADSESVFSTATVEAWEPKYRDMSPDR